MRKASPDAASTLRLSLPEPLVAQVCTLTRHQVLRLGNLRREGALRWQVRKTCRHALPDGGFAFDLHTLIYRPAPVQSPSRLADELAAELAAVLAILQVETAPTGQLVRVTNKPELRVCWAARRPALQARHPAVTTDMLGQLELLLSEGDQLEVLLGSWPEYQLLFPPFYGRLLTRQTPWPGAAVLSHFVGETALPLRTEAWLVGEQPTAAAGCVIEVVGEVDAEQYPAADVRRVLRALLDEPRLDTRVEALHHEQYTFGSGHELLAARRHTRADIQGVMSQELTVLLETSVPGAVSFPSLTNTLA